MKGWNNFKAILAGMIACILVAFILGIALSDSAEVRSYSWAKTFCGGQSTDISEYRYFSSGHVRCKDGRVADVPL